MRQLGAGALVVGLALLLSVVVWQRSVIQTLQTTSCSLRSKRSTDDTAMYLPVYAQLSKKALRRMCAKQLTVMEEALKVKEEKGENRETNEIERSEKVAKERRPRTRSGRKRCSSHARFGSAVRVARRPNHAGAAWRDGDKWYLAEYHLGFAIMEYANVTMLEKSQMKKLHSLPYPFEGTDGLVHNETAMFMYGTRLHSHGMRDGSERHRQMNTSQTHLFSGSQSLVSMSVEEHGYWLVYRTRDTDHLTVERIAKGLKPLSSWQLESVRVESLCNVFIRCGLLYTVECREDTVTIRPVYDFYSSIYVHGESAQWNGSGSLTSIQYDPISKSLATFDNGDIYSIPIEEY